jgi:hypothetical protein
LALVEAADASDGVEARAVAGAADVRWPVCSLLERVEEGALKHEESRMKQERFSRAKYRPEKVVVLRRQPFALRFSQGKFFGKILSCGHWPCKEEGHSKA